MDIDVSGDKINFYKEKKIIIRNSGRSIFQKLVIEMREFKII